MGQPINPNLIPFGAAQPIPQQPVYDYEAAGQQILNIADAMPQDALSNGVVRAAARFGEARFGTESQVGGEAYTQAQLDELEAARDALAQSVENQANVNNLDSANRILLGVRALREAGDQQIAAAPEAGRAISWWGRMGEGGLGRRILRNILVVGLPAAVAGFGVAALLTGGLPFVAVAAIGVVKGAAFGMAGGRVRAALDRRYENTRQFVRGRVDQMMGRVATNMSREITAGNATGQGLTPDQASQLGRNGMIDAAQESQARRDQNQAVSRRAMWQGGAVGAVFGGLGAVVGNFVHDALFENGEAAPGNNAGGNGAGAGAPGGEVAGAQPITPEQVDAWLNQNQPAEWAANADSAAANHDGGIHLWQDVQKGGPNILNNGTTLHTIIPGANEITAHGGHIVGGGDMQFIDGKWTPGQGKWWFSEVTMPKGGMYAIDTNGKVFYFEGTLDHEHQAVLMDLIREKAQIFNRSEFANNVAYHQLPPGFQGAFPNFNGNGQGAGAAGAAANPNASGGVAPNATYAGQGQYYGPGPQGGNPAYWSELNGGNRAPNAVFAGQGQNYVPGPQSDPAYWSQMNGGRSVPYAGQGQNYVPGPQSNPAYWSQLYNDRVPYAGLGRSYSGLQSTPSEWAQMNGSNGAAGNPYEGANPGLTGELPSNQYIDMRAAADEILNQYDTYSQIPVSGTAPNTYVVETLFRDNAAVISGFTPEVQNQLVANMAAAANISQEAARQALQNALESELVPTA
jgi:hypothetical protein